VAGTLSSGWIRGCSADTDGLLLGLDHDHDALVPSGVGRTGVLRGQLVERELRAGSHGKCARKTAWCLRGCCAVAGLGAGVVPALFSRVVMAYRLAEPAWTGCCGEGGSVLMPLHSPGLWCRGL
jgi:hypothetical protein